MDIYMGVTKLYSIQKLISMSLYAYMQILTNNPIKHVIYIQANTDLWETDKESSSSSGNPPYVQGHRIIDFFFQ